MSSGLYNKCNQSDQIADKSCIISQCMEERIDLSPTRNNLSYGSNQFVLQRVNVGINYLA